MKVCKRFASVFALLLVASVLFNTVELQVQTAIIIPTYMIAGGMTGNHRMHIL